MNKQYEAPRLAFVGTADAVVLGSLGVGDDINDEFMSSDAEFQTDQESPHSKT